MQPITPQRPGKTPPACKTEARDDDAGAKVERSGAVRTTLRPPSSPYIDSAQPPTQIERAAADRARPWPGIIASIRAFFRGSDEDQVKSNPNDGHEDPITVTPCVQRIVARSDRGAQSARDNAAADVDSTVDDATVGAPLPHSGATSTSGRLTENHAVVIEAPGDQADDISSPPTEAARSKHVVGADSEDASIDAHDLLIFDKIVGHRRDPQTQMISHMRVRWRNGALTWEPKASIQKCAGEHLLSYWDCVNGTREGAMAESSRRIPEIEKHMTTTASIVTLDLCWVASQERPREPESDVPYSERATLGSSAVGEGGRERATIPVVRRSKRHSRQSLNAIAGPDTVATAQTNAVGPARRQVEQEAFDDRADGTQKPAASGRRY
ncbi:hypothetical protein CSAL01_09022 [Colletotrichum salicis]|uniref:Chromo domain-containing protein n=1 Tax=Colletotrichum salicis TaxID=1209931 RepID=A0A135TDY4_9PEZI|nr:hypothetical protein CSAL01_09022 [Colletotrichum salicis]